MNSLRDKIEKKKKIRKIKDKYESTSIVESRKKKWDKENES